MNQKILDRITKDFPVSAQSRVIEALISYVGREAERVQWDILELSKGSLKNVEHFVTAAQQDYRDILYWAEYYDSDVAGRNPKKMVEDLIENWREGRKPQ